MTGVKKELNAGGAGRESATPRLQPTAWYAISKPADNICALRLYLAAPLPRSPCNQINALKRQQTRRRGLHDQRRRAISPVVGPRGTPHVPLPGTATVPAWAGWYGYRTSDGGPPCLRSRS